MQCIRAQNSLPRLIRVNTSAPAVRNTRNMVLFPRFVTNDFAPMFRFMDDYANHIVSRSGANGLSHALSTSQRTFAPKFDVKEDGTSYILEGELPGINQQDVTIEFTDASTLSIKGRTETFREQSPNPTAALEEAKAQPTATEPSDTTSNHQPTVEDEDAVESTAGAPTPSEGTSTATEPPTERPAAPTSKYWLSERSVGSFARTFSFPSRVDHDNVKASMKDGVLSVIVPKSTAPVNKRVAIQ